jgi:hypothetical protein
MASGAMSGESHSEISRKGGQSRTPAKLLASMENLRKAQAALRSAKRRGLNASKSPAGAGRTRTAEKIEGGKPPIAGERYIRRSGVYVKAAPGKGEIVFRFDGREFRACGLSE